MGRCIRAAGVLGWLGLLSACSIIGGVDLSPQDLGVPSRYEADREYLIDVLIVYFSDDHFAPMDRLERVRQSQSWLHDSLRNSGVRNVTFRVVGHFQVAEPLPGACLEEAESNGAFRRQLADPADGRYDGIHPERDRLRADLVIVFLPCLQDGKVGNAFINQGDPERAVGLVGLKSNLSTYAHEIGHLLGLRHAQGCTFAGQTGFWRSVMSKRSRNRDGDYFRRAPVWCGDGAEYDGARLSGSAVETFTFYVPAVSAFR